MDHTNVNHLTYVGDSVIGSKCNIAAGTNILQIFDLMMEMLKLELKVIE